MHTAIVALERRESIQACVVGGGILEASFQTAFSAAGMLSNSGRCHSFDARANGYCRGEGCLAFVCGPHAGPDFNFLKPEATAVLQDGPSASLTAPNGASQRSLLQIV